MPQIVPWTGSFHSANVCWLSVTWYHYWISHKYDYHHPSSPPMGPNKYISYLSTHVCDLDSYPGHQEILNLHVTCNEPMGHLLPHTDHACRIMISWGRDGIQITELWVWHGCWSNPHTQAAGVTLPLELLGCLIGLGASWERTGVADIVL